MHAPPQNCESEQEPIYDPITVLLYIYISEYHPAFDTNAGLQGVDIYHHLLFEVTYILFNSMSSLTEFCAGLDRSGNFHL